jgi:hypothetical protein
VTSPPPSRRWLLPVLGLVVIVAAGGGLTARSLYRQPPQPQTTAQVVLPPVTTVTVESSTAPDWDKVKLTTDASEYPLSNQIQPVLQNYFDGINEKDYDKWRSSVTQSKAAEQPKSVWQAAYQTVQDGDIIVYRIDLAQGGSLRVLLTFTSTQDVTEAPKDFQHACIHWQVVWALDLEHGQWKLDINAAGTTPGRTPC